MSKLIVGNYSQQWTGYALSWAVFIQHPCLIGERLL